MPAVMPLHFEAQSKLGLNQRQTAELCGISLRTVQRWAGRRSHPSSFDYTALAKASFPVDRDLAARLASAGGTTLVQMGLVVPVPPAPPLAPQTFGPAELVVDSILCAAAIAMDMKPLEIRPALVAAFRRTRQLGIPIEAVERALTGEAPPDGPGKAKKK
jgi:hypothetical protein